MSNMKELLLNVNQIKRYAKQAAKKVTIDVATYGIIDEDDLMEAIMSRYKLDRLLLSKYDLIEKWAQYMVRDFDSGLILFVGTKDKCDYYMLLHDNITHNCELYYILPDDKYFSWYKYIESIKYRNKKKCKIKIGHIR